MKKTLLTWRKRWEIITRLQQDGGRNRIRRRWNSSRLPFPKKPQSKNIKVYRDSDMDTNQHHKTKTWGLQINLCEWSCVHTSSKIQTSDCTTRSSQASVKRRRLTLRSNCDGESVSRLEKRDSQTWALWSQVFLTCSGELAQTVWYTKRKEMTQTPRFHWSCSKDE